jgi:hypothetical protein
LTGLPSLSVNNWPMMALPTTFPSFSISDPLALPWKTAWATPVVTSG